MSIIPGVTVSWGVSPRLINIPSPYGETGNEVTIENLNDTLQDIEDSEEGITFKTLREASGKEALGGGALVGITVKLLNAKVKFADRGSSTVCSISGGNLVAVDANGTAMYAIQAATNVTAVLAQSSSPTLIQDVAEWTAAQKTQILNDVTFIKSFETGRWKIQNNQLICYDTDGTSVLKTFNLFNQQGQPTHESPYERQPL